MSTKLGIAQTATSQELCAALHRDKDLAQYFAEGKDLDNALQLSASSTNKRLGVLHVRNAQELTIQDKDDVVTLFEQNMKDIYLASKDGYHPSEKREELFNDASILLLVRNEDTGALGAFSMFRFDKEDTMVDDEQVDVVYCYEVQVSQVSRGLGLGKILMRCLESLARSYEMQKVMLTVFEANISARKFYKHLNYENDEVCPSEYEYDNAEDKPDYLILSRSIRAKSKRKKKKKPVASGAPDQ